MMRVVWIASTFKDGQRWLEVGPGADACLSKLLLEAHPAAHYWGVEVNKAAFKSSSLALKRFPNAVVINGVVDDNFRVGHTYPANVDAILHEIFGIIASSEGVAKVLAKLRTVYPSAISVPESAQTYIVPLQLTADDLAKDPKLVIGHSSVRGTLAFLKCQLSDDCALLEDLDLNATSIPMHQRHISQCRITKDGTLNALGLYIKISSFGISTTSNSDIAGPTSASFFRAPSTSRRVKQCRSLLKSISTRSARTMPSPSNMKKASTESPSSTHTCTGQMLSNTCT